MVEREVDHFVAAVMGGVVIGIVVEWAIGQGASHVAFMGGGLLTHLALRQRCLYMEARAERRADPSQCHACGYPRAGLDRRGRCPECGALPTPEQVAGGQWLTPQPGQPSK